MKVLKFGGTSISDTNSIEKISTIVKSQDTRLIVVVSAFVGITDTLTKMLQQAVLGKKSYKKMLVEIEKKHLSILQKHFSASRQSAIISFIKKEIKQLSILLKAVFLLKEKTKKIESKITSLGELLSSRIIFEIFKIKKIKADYVNAQDIIFTYVPQEKEIVNISFTKQQCKKYLQTKKSEVIIVPGFIASDEQGEITTLGRGGSDYSAAIIASCIAANSLEIWTDVSGVYTASPKLVSKAKPIKVLSYYEAMELSHFGAKVIYTPTLHPLKEKKIPVYIKNTFSPNDSGTLINYQKNNSTQIVKGISHIENIVLLTLEGDKIMSVPGVSKRLFDTLYQKHINVIMITHASSEHSICIGIDIKDANKAKKAIDECFAFEIMLKKIMPIKIEKNLADIVIVGDEMKNHQGISGKLFSVLGWNNINVIAIAQGSSERNISVIIKKNDVKKALNVIHEIFFETTVKELHLFVMGVGNVGSKLLSQIENQNKYLKEKLSLKINVRGISNSKKMLLGINKNIALKNWKISLEKGEEINRDKFFEQIKKLNLRNSIFIDNTASEEVAKEYERYLKNNINVVASNKIACSGSLTNYQNLKHLSNKYGSDFLFETNVGAGLPIIDTLNNLVDSGDEVLEIQAVLSGSLNFIFDNYKKGITFEEVVRKAQKEGYTEPDPKIDLSGIDVMRKILILARESGFSLELESIQNDNFLPKECLDAKNDTTFFEILNKNESKFSKYLVLAEEKDSQIKYVAQFKNGKAKVGLQFIPKGHDFYNLKGSDIVVLFYTRRYDQQPLIVKGAGAGADVTASGVFADIIRIGKK